MGDDSADPTDDESENQKNQGQRIAFFDAVDLRQDVGGSNRQERPGGDADGDCDILRRKRAEEQISDQDAERRRNKSFDGFFR